MRNSDMRGEQFTVSVKDDGQSLSTILIEAKKEMAF